MSRMDMNGSMHNHHNHHHMGMDTTTAMMMSNNHHNHSHMTNMTTGGMGNGTGMGGHGGHGTGMGGHGDHSGTMHDGMGHMMQMYFHTGIKEYILFESCHTNNNRDMIVACVVMFFVAILYEGLKFVREVLLQHTHRDRARAYYPESKMSAAGNSQEHMVIRGPNLSVASQMLSEGHAIQTFLHIIQVFLSYCLMLVFMTYNVWLCVSVIVGAGVGYFIFGWKRAVIVDANEHCH